ncbi:methionine/alanine import family NSS transporter small subunit [Demequina sp. SYSU T00192]|uniref:Methionine/alanine import family NSS transporter small subunit n=1 Tax=Demequina litoralis TaxID=3051660 RepID=A0ABT8GAS1_9MICO|nr:methionine/alanine import family NSS transporter small subunit [Demequina sp. SYSU T00192]MDN4476237.1 methionine/alanine import family NSS transporter small subunit [Demequina sp. SYSU T00192]
MSTEALILMLVSIVLIWGGLAGSIIVLARKPENDHMPEGGEDTRVPD